MLCEFLLHVLDGRWSSRDEAVVYICYDKAMAMVAIVSEQARFRWALFEPRNGCEHFRSVIIISSGSLFAAVETTSKDGYFAGARKAVRNNYQDGVLNVGMEIRVREIELCCDVLAVCCDGKEHSNVELRCHWRGRVCVCGRVLSSAIDNDPVLGIPVAFDIVKMVCSKGKFADCWRDFLLWNPLPCVEVEDPVAFFVFSAEPLWGCGIASLFEAGGLVLLVMFRQAVVCFRGELGHVVSR